MKSVFFLAVTLMLFNLCAIQAQNIMQSQIPSLVINGFQQMFPKAYDIEWEMDGDKYKVEFETGILRTEHEGWFDNAGKLARHEEEISKFDLPQTIQTKINSDFGGYRIDDSEKVTEGDKVNYIVELKAFKEKWKVAYDAAGNILSRIAD
ncbi:MAG: PepSY-like domain-containing protein [Sphingobacteriales bacterium]|nr:MAG: PepSY-like domain-containing protein [Sphingobacteriales bacterium]